MELLGQIRGSDRFLLLLLAVSLAANVYQYTSTPRPRPAPEPLRVGQRVPPLEATLLRSSSVLGPGRNTLLYVFSPACMWSERNLANAKVLAARAGQRYQFAALAVTEAGIADYLKAEGLDWTVYVSPSERTQREYKLYSTPQTIELSPEGEVLKVWYGALEGERKSEVESHFGVALPGLPTGRQG